MKCSDKEWQHCNKEKMGCKGCFYNDEISVGDYVRSWNGTIGKVTRIEEGRFLYQNKELICFTGSVIKHSKNIIDLIQKDDYVNGNKVIDIAQAPVKAVYTEDREQRLALIPIVNEQIEIVVTKEQIKQIEYRIGD